MNSTGNKAVDMMSSLNITGNVIPVKWCHTIRYPNGKPNLNAIMILSDIVYWYRPREIRDERTGSVIRLEKRFKADLLQRNYQDFADKFGLSKKQTKNAFDLLEELGIIYREFRILEIRGRAINNVLYIGLDVDKLREYTDNDYSNPDGAVSKSTPSQHQSGESPSPDDMTPPTSKCKAVSLDVGTNTENTTEITNGDLSHPIYQKTGYAKVPPSPSEASPMDKMDSIRSLVKRNLEYDSMLCSFRYENEKQRFTEIYELICDVISQSSGSIRIGQQDKPIEVVKSVFSKLTHEHVMYVMDALEKTTSEIKNIRAYLITALYRAPQTINNCINQQVTHDMA